MHFGMTGSLNYYKNRNQKILAGIGNGYSDEILYHSKVYPFTKVGELSEKELKSVFEKEINLEY